LCSPNGIIAAQIWDPATMVTTRTGAPGHLPFDVDSLAVEPDNRKRPQVPFNLVSNMLARWSKPEWISYFFSGAGFEENADAEWIPVRPLAPPNNLKQLIALWKKVDQLGDDVDHIVVKHCPLRPDDDRTYGAGLNNEAVFQAHLSAIPQSHHNNTQLRGYKFYPTATGNVSDESGRLYIRFAPNGTLSDVFYRYRAFRTYLPVLFIWSVLLDLAKASLLMSNCPANWRPILPNDSRDRALWAQDPGAFIVHQDIKPENCFIGINSTKLGRTSPYHPAEMGDFGLSGVCKDTRPPRDFFDWGTHTWFAPEQNHYGEQWQRKIFNFRTPPSGIRDTTNVWPIGKIVANLMKLEDIKFLGAWMGYKRQPRASAAPPFNSAGWDAEDEANYYRRGRHFIDMAEFDCQWQAGRYSEELRKLVYECLRPDHAQGPTAEALFRAAQAGFHSCHRTMRKQNPRPVYHSNGDMNDHVPPPGDADWQFEPLDDPFAFDEGAGIYA
jgi:serine/threonine protein kinase